MTIHDPERKPVEAVARAIYEGRNGRGCVPWSKREAAHKAPYLKDADAAIAVLKPYLLPQFFEAIEADKEASK